MPSIQGPEVTSLPPPGFGRPGSAAPAYQPPGQLDAMRLRRVQAHIAQNLSGGLSVAELAAIACLSPYHFIRCFRRAVGCPPYQYLRGLRLEYAKALLSEPGSSIAQIALESGFSSQASFTRAFRKQAGISPASYRALYRADGRTRQSG